MMATTKLVTGALLLALAAGAGKHAPDGETKSDSRGASALVIRASVPVGLDAHGDARFGIPFLSRGWRVALAWSSARGYLHAAMAITKPSGD